MEPTERVAPPVKYGQEGGGKGGQLFRDFFGFRPDTSIEMPTFFFTLFFFSGTTQPHHEVLLHLVPRRALTPLKNPFFATNGTGEILPLHDSNLNWRNVPDTCQYTAGCTQLKTIP